jgi:hypothetical protein
MSQDDDSVKIDLACKEVQDILVNVTNVPALVLEVMKAVERHVKTNKKQVALTIIDKLQITDINLKIAVVGMVQAGLINHLIDSFVTVAKNSSVLQTLSTIQETTNEIVEKTEEAKTEVKTEVKEAVEAIKGVVEAVESLVDVANEVGKNDGVKEESKGEIKKPKGCCVVM